MDYVATQKFIRMSPKKLRLVTAVVKKLTPVKAVEMLPLLGKRAAFPLVKVIQTAIANAKTKGVDAEVLTFKEIQIGEGPRLKRGRPVSRGRWHPYKRRMSHIRVVLQTAKSLQTTATKSKSKQENLEEKPVADESQAKDTKKKLLDSVKKAVVSKPKAKKL